MPDYELTDRDLERFWSKVVRDAGSDCWYWNGGHFKKTGYATFNVKCADGKWRPTVAHRVSFLIANEYLPPGDTDHVCRDRSCVNPEHLESVTRRVNFLRGDHPTAVLVRDNVCANGHEMTEENTLRRKNGKRECRTCVRSRDNARNANSARKEHYQKMYLQRKQRELASLGGDQSP